MKGRYVLVVSLWLRGDNVVAFEDFERRASSLLARHGGRIERVIRPLWTVGDADTPFEIHIVSFAEQQGYTDYRADPDVRRLAEERERIISRTSVVAGSDVKVY